MDLTVATSMDAGDFLVIQKTNQGDFRAISLTNFLTSILALGVPEGRPEADTQVSAPSANAFSVQIAGSAADKDVHLILTPTAGFAAGTLVLPLASGCRDKQEITVNCTQAITALTITPNGAVAVTGAPTALTANAFFKLCYDLATLTWYRIG